MVSEAPIAETTDRRMMLSTLWIFVMFNYLYTDLASTIFHPEAIRNIAMRMSPGVIVGWTLVLEIAIAMIVLSRVLNYRANRWANILAGALQTVAVVVTSLGGAPPAYYVVTGTLEIACTLFIVWYAWTWKARAATPAAAV